MGRVTIMIKIINILTKEEKILTLQQVIELINSDRSDDFTPYDENDWVEGLEYMTDWKLLK